MSYVLELFATEEIPAVLTEVQRVLGRDSGRFVNLSLSRERPNLLIVTSTHGHSRLAELTQGGVAGAVVRAGIAPVTLVRPREIRGTEAARTS